MPPRLPGVIKEAIVGNVIVRHWLVCWLEPLFGRVKLNIFIGLGIHPQRKLPHEVQHVRIRSLDSLKEAVGNEASQVLLK